jgi:putative tricarboxylic transport membrane protein
MKRQTRVVLLLLPLLFSLPSVCANAQAFQPSRPIELVVHSAPGGGSDVFARAIVQMAEKEKLLPQPLRVVNKIDRASLEAMEYLVEKKGDDHTIAVFTNSWVATPLTSKNAKYSVKDLTPIMRLVLEPQVESGPSPRLRKIV